MAQRLPDAIPDPARLRASDAEREVVVEVLRQAHVHGRLSLTELDERVATAYAARTLAELAPLTTDLPAAVGPDGRVLALPAVPPSRPGLTVSFTRTRRRGPFVLADGFTVQATGASVELDLTEAYIQRQVTTIVVNAVLSRVRLVVPEGVEVHLDGRSLGTGRRALPWPGRRKPRPDPPVLVVHASNALSSVKIARP